MNEANSQIVYVGKEYFATVQGFRRAPDWQKQLLLRGSICQMCRTLEPGYLRLRLRRFWEAQATLFQLDTTELKTWA